MNPGRDGMTGLCAMRGPAAAATAAVGVRGEARVRREAPTSAVSGRGVLRRRGLMAGQPLGVRGRWGGGVRADGLNCGAPMEALRSLLLARRAAGCGAAVEGTPLRVRAWLGAVPGLTHGMDARSADARPGVVVGAVGVPVDLAERAAVGMREVGVRREVTLALTPPAACPRSRACAPVLLLPMLRLDARCGRGDVVGWDRALSDAASRCTAVAVLALERRSSGEDVSGEGLCHSLPAAEATDGVATSHCSGSIKSSISAEGKQVGMPAQVLHVACA